MKYIGKVFTSIVREARRLEMEMETAPEFWVVMVRLMVMMMSSFLD